MAQQPNWGADSFFEVSRTQNYTNTPIMIRLHAWSARRRGRYVHTTQQKKRRTSTPLTRFEPGIDPHTILVYIIIVTPRYQVVDVKWAVWCSGRCLQCETDHQSGDNHCFTQSFQLIARTVLLIGYHRFVCEVLSSLSLINLSDLNFSDLNFIFFWPCIFV